METAVALSVVAALVVVNGLATRIVLREPYSERHQKVYQCLAVWLLPVLRAIFIFALHRKPEKPTGRYPESPDPRWDDITGAGGVGRASHMHVDD